jgi:hypothetical protein
MTNAEIKGLSRRALADAYARAHAQAKAAEKALEPLKAEVLARGLPEIDGASATIHIDDVTVGTFDAKKGKTFLTARQLSECTGTRTDRKVRVEYRHAEMLREVA